MFLTYFILLFPWRNVLETTEVEFKHLMDSTPTQGENRLKQAVLQNARSKAIECDVGAFDGTFPTIIVIII